MQDMQMYVAPSWLTSLSWTFVVLSIACAAWIARDFYARGNRQPSVIAEAVWLVGALAVGPLALWIYRRWGTQQTSDSAGSAMTGGLAGGAASAVAHVIGVPLIVVTGLSIAGVALWPMMIAIALLAIVLLAAIELRAVDTGQRARLRQALATATLTVVAFDVGMGAWMLLLHFNELMPANSDVAFVFLMQVGIALGFVTGLPMVAWLAGRKRTAVTPAGVLSAP